MKKAWFAVFSVYPALTFGCTSHSSMTGNVEREVAKIVEEKQRCLSEAVNLPISSEEIETLVKRATSNSDFAMLVSYLEENQDCVASQDQPVKVTRFSCPVQGNHLTETKARFSLVCASHKAKAELVFAMQSLENLDQNKEAPAVAAMLFESDHSQSKMLTIDDSGKIVQSELDFSQSNGLLGNESSQAACAEGAGGVGVASAGVGAVIGASVGWLQATNEHSQSVAKAFAELMQQVGGVVTAWGSSTRDARGGGWKAALASQMSVSSSQFSGSTALPLGEGVLGTKVANIVVALLDETTLHAMRQANDRLKKIRAEYADSKGGFYRRPNREVLEQVINDLRLIDFGNKRAQEFVISKSFETLTPATLDRLIEYSEEVAGRFPTLVTPKTMQGIHTLRSNLDILVTNLGTSQNINDFSKLILIILESIEKGVVDPISKLSAVDKETGWIGFLQGPVEDTILRENQLAVIARKSESLFGVALPWTFNEAAMARVHQALGPKLRSSVGWGLVGGAALGLVGTVVWIAVDGIGGWWNREC